MNNLLCFGGAGFFNETMIDKTCGNVIIFLGKLKQNKHKEL